MSGLWLLCYMGDKNKPSSKSWGPQDDARGDDVAIIKVQDANVNLLS